MGCGQSIEEDADPTPEPAPEREPSMTPAQREMAAINAKIAAAPKKEGAKAFKKGDKTTHKVHRAGGGAFVESDEAAEINKKLAEKKAAAAKAAAAAAAEQKPRLTKAFSLGGIALKRAMSSADTVVRQTTRNVREKSRRTLTRGRSGRQTTGKRGLVRQLTQSMFGNKGGASATALTSDGREQSQTEYRDTNGEIIPRETINTTINATLNQLIAGDEAMVPDLSANARWKANDVQGAGAPAGAKVKTPAPHNHKTSVEFKQQENLQA
uniref:Uncharacterized protein n=1 Tax=Haptolina brevifila TaxID=156173 RepID=A0A7S2N7Z9_9EUKA|mmetsp:Transcript_68962/g.136717  ORF Transcript_68962/g.136717 Transcript_68962/m.136717 type:complete len:268 (+) Transcript_68962:89-892(+)